MSFNTYTPPGWWDRTRMLRYAFAGGVVVGIGIGWFFHGLISLAIRFGVVAVLLVPLTLLAFMWWRSSRERSRMQSTMTVMRWSGEPLTGFGMDARPDPYGHVRFEQGDVVDVNDHRQGEPPR